MTEKARRIKYRLMDRYAGLIEDGDLLTANRVLHLLRKRKACTGLGYEPDWNLEIIADECGCNIRYGRNFNVAHISF